MAEIDKIYGSYEQYDELVPWFLKEKPEWECYILPKFGYTTDLNGKRPILNTPVMVDQWLWQNCPFPWVKTELEKMYSPKHIKHLMAK